MIGLDSNVLLRAFTDDDPIQSPKARALLATLSEKRPAYVNLIVLAEVTWSLARKYKASREDIHAAVETLLRGSGFVVEAHDVIAAALELTQSAKASFNDTLIGLLNGRAGCEHTLTFDRRAPAGAGFENFR